MSCTNVQDKTQATSCQINMATKDQDKKLTSIKCVPNPQHNTPDKKLYCYDNANIAIYHKYTNTQTTCTNKSLHFKCLLHRPTYRVSITILNSYMAQG